MHIEKTSGICMVCNGEIIERIKRIFDPSLGPQVIGVDGPSNHQFKNVSEGYYCKKCGIKYEFIPQIRLVRKKWLGLFG